MSELMFSLNATVPIFVMMLLGVFFKKINLIDDSFASKMNSFVFKVALPVMLFNDLATVDFSESWNGGFVLFCFCVTVISIAISFVVSLFFDKSIRGEYIQVSYRSSAAILGLAFITNIYGTSGMAPMMIIGSVPLYNVMAVVVLCAFKPGEKEDTKQLVKRTLIGVAKNPIILGIVIGLLWSLLKIPTPEMLTKSTSMLGQVASPLGLIAMGASFDIHKAFAKVKPAVAAAIFKLVGFCAIFIPIAVALGFRNEELVAILVMLGSCSTVTCYVMAKNMGHEGVLSASTVMLTTMFSAFTLTMWLFILRTMGYI
jgi:predicted permease